MEEKMCDARSRRRGASATALIIGLTALALLAFAGVAQAKKSTVWLCKPGHNPNPCMASRDTTIVTYSGETRHEEVQKAAKTHKPPIDCFYVYPTVSEQEGPNADLTIEPQETQIAIDQASRFSQVCRVFAPMYRQLTLKAINTPGAIKPENQLIAFEGVRTAFTEYLSKYNK